MPVPVPVHVCPQTLSQSIATIARGSPVFNAARMQATWEAAYAGVWELRMLQSRRRGEEVARESGADYHVVITPLATPPTVAVTEPDSDSDSVSDSVSEPAVAAAGQTGALIALAAVADDAFMAQVWSCVILCGHHVTITLATITLLNGYFSDASLSYNTSPPHRTVLQYLHNSP